MKKITLLGLYLVFSQAIFSQNITITTDNTSVNEGAAFTLTATLDAVSTEDITLPVSVTGSASSISDYTVSFATQGSESILSSEVYGNKLEILSDGQYLMWTSSELKILNPATSTFTTYNLPRGYERIKPFGDAFYANTSDVLYKLEFDENNVITETVIEQLSNGYGFNYHFYVKGNSLIYQVVRYDNGVRWVYVKEGDNTPEQIFTGAVCCYSPVMYNDKYFMIGNNQVYEIIDGALTNYIYLEDSHSIYFDRIKEFNGKLYISNYDSSSSTNKVSVFDPTTGSFEDVGYQTQDADFMNYDFIYDNANLIVLDQVAPAEDRLYKYQFSPQFSIAAGEISATIVFEITDDNSDEAEELITLTPGTPTSGALSDTSPLDITITDDDDSAVVTFTFSSENLLENSSSPVTLTATANPISGQQISIPITLSGTASASEYSTNATEIIISAGSATGNISISGVDDTEVEVIETIIITPGVITNGTTETLDLTLNLLSEDNPVGTLSSTSLEVTEGGISTVTLEIDSATSQDITVPVELSGTAVFNQDYTTQFDTQGDESLVAVVASSYNNMEVLEDGRYLYGSGNNKLRIYDTITQTEEIYEINYDNNYIGINSFSVSGSSIFINGNNRITKLSIADLVPNPNNNQINTTLVFDGTNLGTNDYLEGNYVSSENETVIYQVRDYPTGWKIYKKNADNSAEIIYDGDEYSQQLFILNDRVYKYDSYNIRELYDGEFTQSISYSSYLTRVKIENGLAYALTEQNNTRSIVKLSVEQDIINSGSGTITQLPYVLGDTHNYTYDFSLDISGNLIMQNRVFENDNFNYGIYKYQLFPEIVIPAGSTSANLSLIYTDDLSNEESETIIVTPVDVENVDISATSLELTILDDDDEPTIIFEFSSESINENSTDSVTLTAISNSASGIEITIPFTLDESTASSDEYTVSANEIVIPANQTSASITISPGTDDTVVEITETIVFTFGEIVNASTQQQSVTLNLESDDNPNLVSLVSTTLEIEEGEATEIIATIDEATSNDVFLSILLGGTATENIDYETDFVSRGEQSLALGLSNSSYTRFGTLPDGRYVYWNDGATFVVYDPVSETTQTATNFPGNDYRFMRIIGDNIYVAGWGGIASVDISNISSGSVTLNTVIAQENNVNVVNISGFQPNTALDVMVYAVDDNQQNRRRIYEIEIGGGNNNPTLIFETTEYPSVIKRFGKVYVFLYYQFYELVNGVLTNGRNYTSQSNQLEIEWSDNNSPRLINGNIYVRGRYENFGNIYKLDSDTGNLELLNYTTSNNISYTWDYDFSQDGNILLLNSYSDDENNNYRGIFSYLQTLQVKVPAGELNGSVTILAIEDDSYEPIETISVTAGTPVNAILDSSIEAFEIEILNNDAEPSIIFEFSSESILEDSTTPVQLMATLSAVSAFDVTIPFTTISGSAEADEFTVVDTEILIVAGETTASIDVLAIDDTEVEFSETIIFTFGEIEGGSSEQETATLNLLSDDDPTLVSIVAEPLEFAEHESTVITATIDLPTSEDVFITMNFSGTATKEVDYNIISESIGQESFISILEGLNGQPLFDILADGRYVIIDNYNDRRIHIYDSTSGNLVTEQTSNYYYYLTIDDNDIYVSDGSNGIFKLDISDIENGVISRELEIDLQALSLNLNGYQFSAENETILFNTNSNGTNQTWIREGASGSPVLLTTNTNNDCCLKPMLVDGDIYQFETWWFKKYNLDTGEYSEEQYYLNENLQNYYNGFNRDRKLATNNGEVYYYSGSGEVFKLNLESFVYNQASYLYSDQINSSSSFDFDTNGDLIMLNNYTTSTDDNGNASATSLGFFSYNQNPRVKVAAGETSGSISINGMEDDLNSPGEETDETIDVSFLSTENLIVSDPDLLSDINLTLLNNEISLSEDTDALANVPALTSSSVAWGDYDRDGDQDLAIMGYNGDIGLITRLYENVNGVFVQNMPEGTFTKKYLGDIMWVDYNKDGYVDLVVSGLDVNDTPSTTIYQNNEGLTFTTSTELSLPNLFSTSMDSGDLDNDGDIDFVIAGIDENNEWKKYIYFREQNSLVQSESYNGQFDENGYEYPQVKIGDVNFDGDLDIFYLGENGGFIKNNTLINNSDNYEQYLNSYKGVSMELFGNYLYFMGEDNSGNYQLNRINLQSGYNDQYDFQNIEGLKNGDIAVADYNNDGLEDLLITGESSSGESVTKLYDGKVEIAGAMNGFMYFSENTDIDLIGLRESTAAWVDYDVDGDLDLFITGTSDSGDFNKLYKTNQLNKTNEASNAITEFTYESIGNGKVKLSWIAPEDDFSETLGYILRLGTSEGGSELSNTESNLETGQRLITKSPVIYSNSFEIQLDPGSYYWAVQSVDSGLKGSVFSEEQSFQLTYEWKLLNQGGIIDQSINALQDPVVKLSDIDGDNDMDLVYGSSSNSSDLSVFSLNGNKFDYLNNLNNSRNVSDMAFFDFNNDFVLDILVNTWESSGNNSFKLYNSQGDGQFQEEFNTSGLYEAKIELIDIDNDGSDEVILIGRTSELPNSQLKVLLYQQEGTTIGSNPIDISNQVSSLKNASSAFGDIDNDQDIDFAITGSSNSGTQSKVYFNDTQYEDTINPIYTLSDINFDRVTSSTLDFVDFDADGDLDMVVSGNAVGVGVIFKILINNGLQATELAFEEMLNTGLIPIRNAKLDFGDYNGDGYLDILYTGVVSGSGKITKLVEYDPINQTYTESDFDLSDIVNASIAFGDVDGDNDLDFTIAGESILGNNNTIKTYLNVRNESAAVISNASRIMYTALNVDPVEYIVNDKPSIPTNLISEDIGYDSETDTHKVKFRWDASEDDNTPTKGLTYSLKVGTTPGGDEVMKVNALSNGYRLSAGKGNVEHNKEWTLNLPNNQYYWSVQAIDASFSGSVFSETQSSISLGVQSPSLSMVNSYPNPMRDFYVINSPNPLSLRIYDLTGKLINSYKLISGENQIDTSYLAAGTYIFNMKSDRAVKSILVIKD